MDKEKIIREFHFEQKITVHVNKIALHVDINKPHVNVNMLYVINTNKSHDEC